jgi:hypothetical protein
MDTITLSPEYVHRLARVQAEMQKVSGSTVSLPGLVEEIISDWLYTHETALELSPRGLPIKEIQGTRYYRDARLNEYRNVENPHDRLPLDTTETPALGSGREYLVPQVITREEWAEIVQLPQIRAAWGLDADTTPEEFASHCYGARYDFSSGGPGYCGDLFMLYGDALSGMPFLLIRDAEYRLQVIEDEEA